MAGNYDNTNSGALFVNATKQEAKHPDYEGSINVDGKEYWIKGWKKKAGERAKNPGSTFISLAVSPKEQRGSSSSNSSRNSRRQDDDDFPS